MAISKWAILILVCATAFGSYYSFETPSVLHNAMLSHYGFTDAAQFEFYFSLIYSLYALPNTVLPLVGGFLADKFGNKTVMLSVATIVLLGSAIETTSYFTRSMTTFLVGRFIFGCGAETLNVCCSMVISRWFKGQELALALAINLSLSKLATVVTDWTSPLMYRKIGIENNAVWVTTLCLICYLLTIVLLKYDSEEHMAHPVGASTANRGADRSNRDIELSRISETTALLRNDNGSRHSSDHQVNVRTGTHPPPVPPCPQQQYECMGFTPTAWALFLFTFAMYGTFIPFTNWSSVILIRFYFTVPNPTAAFITYREITAARLQSIPNFLSVFLTPLFGVSVDKFGRRTALLASAALLLVVAHSVIFTHSLASPVLPLLLIGLAFSIFGSVIWPCVPVVVPLEHQGTAYGVMTSFQNAGQFVVPLFLQHIYSLQRSYVPCEGFFIVMSCFCAAVAGVIWVLDETWNNAILRLPDTSGLEEEAIIEPDRGDRGDAGGKGRGDRAGESGALLGGDAQYRSANTPTEAGSNGFSPDYGSVEYGSTGNYQCPLGGEGLGCTMLPLRNSQGAGSNSVFCSSNSSLSTDSAMFEYMGGPHGSDGPQSPGLLKDSRFACMRAYSLPESRQSVSANLSALSEEASQVSIRSGTGSGSASCSSQPLSQRGDSTSPGTAALRPIMIIPIPKVVHYSQEHYERANSLQFPREDPLALRRQISERRRVDAPPPGWLGIAHSAPSAPCTQSQLEEYQAYRQAQIAAHNQMPQVEQQKHLLLGPARKSLRMVF